MYEANVTEEKCQQNHTNSQNKKQQTTNISLSILTTYSILLFLLSSVILDKG